MLQPERTIIASTLGLLWGLLIAVLAVKLSEGGHGWNAAILFGIVAIIMSPVACVLWVKRHTVTTNVLIISLIIAITADIGLFQASWNEGLSAFQRVADHAITWLMLWMSWQFLLLLNAIEVLTKDVNGGS